MFFLAATSASYWPFVVLAVSVAFIIVGISVLRLHAFLALILAAMLAGLMTGQDSWEYRAKGRQGEIRVVDGGRGGDGVEGARRYGARHRHFNRPRGGDRHVYDGKRRRG